MYYLYFKYSVVLILATYCYNVKGGFCVPVSRNFSWQMANNRFLLDASSTQQYFIDKAVTLFSNALLSVNSKSLYQFYQGSTGKLYKLQHSTSRMIPVFHCQPQTVKQAEQLSNNIPELSLSIDPHAKSVKCINHSV